MKWFLVLNLVFSLFIFSCAPVKFSKSDNVSVNNNGGGGSNVTTITCSPVINTSAMSHTYLVGNPLPNISSRCNVPNLVYTWTVRRADNSVVNNTVSGLSGENPASVNFQPLGVGNYYVYLTAAGSGLNPYVATIPLEFIVPSGGPLPTLSCNPRLNGSATSLTLNSGDANPVVSAGCTPVATQHVWNVTRNGVPVAISNLAGASSTADFQAAGPGTYVISLYATESGYQAYNAPTPMTVVVAAGSGGGPIACAPRINGSLTSLTLTASTPNPLISANCVPSAVQYNWSVSLNGGSVTLPGLGGANSNPNFSSLAIGTYQIYLTATAPGQTAWQASTPLTITVTASNSSTISCAPRINTNLVSLTMTMAMSNPAISSNCTPSGATLAWTVTRNGTPVTVPGLAGANSIPNFTSLGLGTYLIYLNATNAGYNAYASPSPLTLIIDTFVGPVRNVAYNKTVTREDNKVDFLLVVDDSNSMLTDNQHLASRMQTFVNDIVSSGFDWQMCTTVTRAQDVFNNGNLYWGASKYWTGNATAVPWLLLPTAPNPYQIFTNTINTIGAGWAGTDDERGIKAAWWHFDNKDYNSCYRNDAAIAMIILSDEDERSIGGDAYQQYYYNELKLLEADDQPQALVNKMKQMFGTNKRFTANSVIVKPGDTACKAAQDAGGAQSHYGVKYAELSNLTGGAITSICASDYAQNLYYFKDKIIDSLSSVQLECAPVNPVNVLITPSMGGVTSSLVGNTLTFSSPIPIGRTVAINYQCAP